jgi:hypothetical protein
LKRDYQNLDFAEPSENPKCCALKFAKIRSRLQEDYGVDIPI